MTRDLAQLVRLEVERDPDPGEVLNLNPNPSGDLGAWAYETPVPGSDLVAGVVGGVRRLTYYSPGGVASYFQTEPMAADAGQYAVARWLAPTVGGLYAVRFDWLDVTRTLISSTTASASVGASADVRTYAPASAAPVGTAYVRMRFDHYDGSGGNPTALSSIAFRDLVVTVGSSMSALSWQRVNLIPTPTGDGGHGDWGSGGGDVGTASSVTLNGRASLLLKKTDEDGPAALVSPAIAVAPGRDYALQARSRAQGHGRHATVAVRWFKANGDEIRTVELGSADDTSGSWTGVIGGVATAPTNAATMRLRVQYRTMDKGETHYVNAVMVEQAVTVGGWFDGDSTDIDGITDIDFEWSGTAHASTSVATSSIGDPGDLVPVPYQNILGSSSQIRVDREDLNVGSMSVQLFDAVLDPTQSVIIRPGRRLRLLTVDGDVVFAGKIFTGSVTYHLTERDEHKRAEVSITAVDPINSLASAPRREGVATIAELPYVVEGAGVPWSINGSGNQVPTATVVAYNDNASALDQVAVTRDSALGYAWVDRNGVLQVWDRDLIDTTVSQVLGEDTYNADADFSFELDRIINSVTVRVLRVIATTGASEEVVFGPYVDVDSYRAYSEHSQEYVVQGLDPADTASIQAYAQQILDANATPRIRANSLVLPIRAADDLPLALLDLYDLVTVQNARASLDEDARVTTLQHEITATASGFKWLVTVGFSAEGSVAPSTAVPAPPPSVGQVVDEVRGGYGGSLQEIYDSADAAAAAAAEAAAIGTAAQTSANGKNTVTYSTSPPGTTTNTAGDIWFQKDPSTQTIIHQFTGLGGTTWVEVQITNAVIANLDAGKLTAGSAFINGLAVKTNFTLGDASTNGVIQSYNFASSSVGVYLDKYGLVAKGGSITGATVTGGLVQTASSGYRVALSEFLGSASVWFLGPSSAIGAIAGGSSGITFDAFGGMFYFADNVDVAGTLSADTLSGAHTGTASLSGTFSGTHSGSWSGGMTASGAVHGSTIYADSVPTTGSAINAVMGASGQFLMNTSSRRYKYDDEPFEINLAAVRALVHKRFRRYDDEAYDEAHPELGRWYYGVIAEEAQDLDLTPWLIFDAEDQLQSFDYPGFATAVALAVAREYDERLTDLTARIEALEAR